MPFEEIDFLGSPSTKSPTVPPSGLRVTARSVGQRGGGKAHFIQVTLGEALSKKLALTEAQHAFALQFGTGTDAGRVRVLASDGGKFVARRDKQDRYAFTINGATLEGLFAKQFPPFIREKVPVSPPANGSGFAFTFEASEQMLEAD